VIVVEAEMGDQDLPQLGAGKPYAPRPYAFSHFHRPQQSVFISLLAPLQSLQNPLFEPTQLELTPHFFFFYSVPSSPLRRRFSKANYQTAVTLAADHLNQFSPNADIILSSSFFLIKGGKRGTPTSFSSPSLPTTPVSTETPFTAGRLWLTGTQNHSIDLQVVIFRQFFT
jgi:hypothetical protein